MTRLATVALRRVAPFQVPAIDWRAWLPEFSVRVARLVRSHPALAICLVVACAQALAMVAVAATTWTNADMDAYWNAALRLRDGAPLYPSSDPWASSTYHYAPWFAVAWVPLSYLPHSVVAVAWSAILLSATGLVVATLLRHGLSGMVLAGVLGPYLLSTASGGNVQPLLVAALLMGVRRRSGPLWIALAASLKAFPLALTLVYIGRREWRKAVGTLVLFVLLMAPMAMVDLSHYPLGLGEVGGLALVSPWLWAAGVLGAGGVALYQSSRRARTTWLSASLAVVLASPRLFYYDVTYLLVGIVDGT